MHRITNITITAEILKLISEIDGNFVIRVGDASDNTPLMTEVGLK